jgi:hypothetical protein
MEEVAAELARLVGARIDTPGSLGCDAASSGIGAASRRGDGPRPLFAAISVGELIDKITILEIKTARVSDPQKRAEIAKELNLLNQIDYGAAECSQELDRLKKELKEVNESLWVVEDRLRDHEREQDFGPGFVQLARAVYKTNDQRAALKRRINELSASALMEVKAHPAY